MRPRNAVLHTAVLAIACAPTAASVTAAATCPAGMTEMAAAAPWRGAHYTVCERVGPGGELQFLPAGAAAVVVGAITVERSAVPLFNTNATCGKGSSCAAAVSASAADHIGNTILAQPGDPTLAEVARSLPPLVLVGGYDFNDPIQCKTHGQKEGCKAYSYPGGVHTFVGSRSSSAGIVFDTLGSDVMSEGHPSMNQFIHKYGLSMATFKDKLDPMVILEGLCEPSCATIHSCSAPRPLVCPTDSSSVAPAQGAATSRLSRIGIRSRRALCAGHRAPSLTSPARPQKATPSARPTLPRDSATDLLLQTAPAEGSRRVGVGSSSRRCRSRTCRVRWSRMRTSVCRGPI